MSDAPDPLAAAALKSIIGPFGAVLRLEPADATPLWIDGRAAPIKVAATAPTPEADCVWRGSRETILRALDDERALSSAFLSGRLAISGDMSVMARLQLKWDRHG